MPAENPTDNTNNNTKPSIDAVPLLDNPKFYHNPLISESVVRPSGLMDAARVMPAFVST